MQEYCVVFITTPDRESAERIANFTVENKLGACVNIVQLHQSVFFWKGNIESYQEHLLIIKTRIEKFQELENQIKSIHPYSVPEIIAIPIIAGNQEYLDWIDETLNRG